MRDMSGCRDPSESEKTRKRKSEKAGLPRSPSDRRYSLFSCFFVLSLLFCGPTLAQDAPHLLVTPDIIRNAQAKAAAQPWARAVLDKLTAEADKWIARPVSPPTTGGGWGHNYVCPKDASFLKYDENSPHRHWCPACKAYYEGPQMDEAWVGMTHQSYARAAVSCGLAFQLTGKREYADWTGRVILWYAQRYDAFPVHGRWAGRGKVGGQSLDEAVWLVQMLNAFDLVNGTLTDADRATIIDKLAVPAAAHIEKYSGGVNNIECWHATARLLAALMAGRSDIRDRAVASLRRNIDQGITDDGFWFEGSIVYHEYVLTTLSPALLAAKHNGIDLGRPERLLAMYVAPSRLVLADLDLPSLNDGWAGYTLDGMAPLLETACSLFQDARLAQQLGAIYREGGPKRTSPDALLYGPETLPADERLELGCYAMPKAGLVAMRQGGNTVILKAGAKHGGHDHSDRLNLIFADRERNWFADLGTPGYGHPLTRRWYKQTVGHCTVLVDDKPQAINVSGRIVQFDDKPDYKLASVECDEAYPGVKMKRTVAMIDGLVLDRFEVLSTREHDYAFMLHAPGSLTFQDATAGGVEADALELGPVRFVHVATAGRAVRGKWTEAASTQPASRSSGPQAAKPRKGTVGTGTLHVSASASAPFRAYTAEVPGLPGGSTLRALAILSRSRGVTFAAAYASENTTGERIAAVAFEPNGSVRFSTETGHTYEMTLTKEQAAVRRQ